MATAAVTTVSNWILDGATTLGTGATITAIDAVTHGGVSYASQYLVTGGAGRTYTSGTTLTIAAANVVGTAGSGSDTAAADVVFTLPDIVAPGAVNPPLYVSADNYVNNTEATTAGGFGTAFAFTANSDNSKIRYYLNGVELTGKVSSVAAADTSKTLTLLPEDFVGLADGRYSLTARLEDSTSTSGGTVGNLGAMSPSKVFTLDRNLDQGLASARLSTDANGNGSADAGDVVTVVFNESVNMTAASLPAAFGSGATVAALGAGYGDTALSNTWSVTLGTSPSLSAGQAVTFTSVKDVAGNTGTVAGTLPADVMSAPAITQVGNVTSDNVINSSESAMAQAITVNLSGAKTGDVVKLYMDGVQVGSDYTLTSTDQTNQTASFTVEANSWGADGERILTSTIQRDAGTLQSSGQRSVAVSADGSHWAASGVLWFDPDTLEAGTSITTWTPSAGVGDATANTGVPSVATPPTTPFQVITANTGANYLVFDGSNWMSFLSSTIAGATNLSVFNAFQLNQVPGSDYPSVYQVGGYSYADSPGDIAGATGIGLELADNNNFRPGNWATTEFMASWANTLQVGAAATFSQVFDFTGGTASSQLNGDFFDSGASGNPTTVISTGVNGYFGIYGNTFPDTTRYKGQFGDFIVADRALGTAATQEIEAYMAIKYQSAGAVVTSTSTVVVSGASTPGVYDLSGSDNATNFLDQVLDVRTSASGGVTVSTAGHDWVATGSGADAVYVNDLDFRSIDAGMGYDRLVLDSSYDVAGTIVLSDFVSNARGDSGVGVDDARVNAAGFHKLQGFEQIDLSQSMAAQAITVDKTDVSQLAGIDANNSTDTNAHTLAVVLGANDTLNVTGFTDDNATWGYYSFNGTVYDQRWLDTNGETGNSEQTMILYARGLNISGANPAGFNLVSGSTGGVDTLTGTAGNDVLQGGQGDDLLSGGAAADIFRYVKGDFGSDTVADFAKLEGDRIDLSGLLEDTSFDLASNVTDYLQLTTNGDGNAVLKVDVYGEANFTTPDQTILFTNGASSGMGDPELLAALLDQRVILI